MEPRGEDSVFKIVHYLNQFFGQIGGEEKASVGVSFRGGAVGSGALLDKLFLHKGSVVQTVICGDNFFAEHTAEAIALILDRVRAVGADLFIAGPAFKAGRYGVACGRLCAESTTRWA